MKRRYLFASLIIHLLFLGIGFNSGKGSGDSDAESNNSDEKQIAVQIIDKIPEEKEFKPKVEEEKGLGMAPPQAPVEPDCVKFFGGIGVTYGNPMDFGGFGVVRTVHRGYPAERAGIQAGDQILNHSQIRGEIGSRVEVRILRGSETLTFSIIREKICTEDVNK